MRNGGVMGNWWVKKEEKPEHATNQKKVQTLFWGSGKHIGSNGLCWWNSLLRMAFGQLGATLELLYSASQYLFSKRFIFLLTPEKFATTMGKTFQLVGNLYL